MRFHLRILALLLVIFVSAATKNAVRAAAPDSPAPGLPFQQETPVPFGDTGDQGVRETHAVPNTGGETASEASYSWQTFLGFALVGLVFLGVLIGLLLGNRRRRSM